MEKHNREKQSYEAPIFKKVRLEVKESLLGDCFLSPTNNPAALGCRTLTAGCVMSPGIR